MLLPRWRRPRGACPQGHGAKHSTRGWNHRGGTAFLLRTTVNSITYRRGSMRAILLATVAVIFSAASISSASAQNPPLNMDWSGIYVGGNIGGTWGRTN